MKISNIAINRPVTVSMMILMVIVLGVVSFTGISLDMLPDISLPIAVVMTTYQGAGPQEIEEMISKPMEQVMGTVDNFKEVSSTSANGMSTVIVQFAQGTNMDYAALQMREKVDMVKNILPDEVSPPQILQYDVSMLPVIQFGMSGTGDLAQLKTILDNQVKNRLERLKGVAAVDIMGGLEKEIKINIIPEKVEGYGITLQQISQILKAENLNLPGGQIEDGKLELIVRTSGEFSNINEIENLPIASPAGTIYFKDIAEIEDGFKDISTNAFMNGNPCLLLQVKKQSGFNTVKVADEVNLEIKKIKEELKELEFHTIFDQSDFIKLSLNSVTSSAIIGGILAIIILFIFLKNIRTTLIIGIAIPISIISTFILIYFSGITLNMMSLGGLALGVGMLVDNSIVVLESIYRYREKGYDKIDAAKDGCNEVAMAVTASTLTTIAVFLPIAFIKENMAIEMFRELALTVTFSLFASLLVSLTLVPMLAAQILVIEKENNKKDKISFISKISLKIEAIIKETENKYKKLLNWSMGHRKMVIIITIILFISSIISAAIFTGAEFFPDGDSGMFTASINLPKGVVLEETIKASEKVQEKIQEIDDLEYIFVMHGNEGDASTATIFASFGSTSNRKKGIDDLLDEVRAKLADIAGVQISISKMQMMGLGAGGGKPISIAIKGDDLEILTEISNLLANNIKDIEGTREIETSVSDAIPEATIKIDRQRAAYYGISAYAIANTVQTSIMGSIATRYKVEGEEIDVRVILESGSRKNIDNLKNIMISNPQGLQLPLYELAEIEIGKSPISINRANQVRLVSVTGDIVGRNPASVFKDIQKEIETMNIPEGYEIEFGGENKEMQDAIYAFGMALILAVILVYMIMASQFESILHPFTIMFTLPLAFIGVAFAMALTRKPFSVPAFIGIIMLAGIVVNNAIVLIDYINILRKKGMERNQAIFEAGPVRLRPILMTTLTTVLGLFPLALGIGEGSEMQIPLAITVIGGLTFSTLLTLVFIPVLYTLFDDFGIKIKNLFSRRKTSPQTISKTT